MKAPRIADRWQRALARIAPLVAAAGLLVLTSLRLGAQQPGTLTGIITSADRSPVAYAHVTLVGTTLAVVSSADGRFRIAAIPGGRQSLEVKMLGYRTVAVPVEIVAGQTVDLPVMLAIAPVALKSVEVTAESTLPPEVWGFQERRARGAGTFFTRDDIARMQPRLFTDVLRRVPGMRIQSVSGGYGGGYSVQSGRTGGGSGGRPCPVLFYVNGAPFPLNSDIAVNHFIAPEEVVAVEVYSGSAQIPQRFSSSMYTATCGVVVIWTRSGPEARLSR